ncbi:hypothetical protein EDB86DRAFT_2405262 [Lactarius hatsudake]|nr:hypothetical protein EDB86DRAFT_2405262 [Lactarius hatsudake]
MGIEGKCLGEIVVELVGRGARLCGTWPQHHGHPPSDPRISPFTSGENPTSFLSETIAQHDAFFSQKRQPLSAKARPGCDHSFFPDPAGQGQGQHSADFWKSDRCAGGHAAVQVAIRRDDRDHGSHRETQGCDNVRVSWEGGAEPEAIECVRLHATDKTASSAWSAIIGGRLSIIQLRSALSNVPHVLDRNAAGPLTRDYTMTICSGQPSVQRVQE